MTTPGTHSPFRGIAGADGFPSFPRPLESFDSLYGSRSLTVRHSVQRKVLRLRGHRMVQLQVRHFPVVISSPGTGRGGPLCGLDERGSGK